MADNWEVVDAAVEYSNPYFSVEREQVRTSDGRESDYYRIDFEEDGVVSLGVEDGDVLFVDLYRPRLGRRTLELPGGAIDPGESPEAAARREFAEETGYVPGSSRLLGSFFFSAWTRSRRHVVWVDDLEHAADGRAEPEVQRVVRVPARDALDRVVGEAACEWNVTPLLLAARRGLVDAL